MNSSGVLQARDAVGEQPLAVGGRDLPRQDLGGGRPRQLGRGLAQLLAGGGEAAVDLLARVLADARDLFVGARGERPAGLLAIGDSLPADLLDVLLDLRGPLADVAREAFDRGALLLGLEAPLLDLVLA